MRRELDELARELIAEALVPAQVADDEYEEWFKFDDDTLPTHAIEGFGEVVVRARSLDLMDPDLDEMSSHNSVHGLNVEFELGGERIGTLHALIVDARDRGLETYVLPYPPLLGWASTFMNGSGELHPVAQRVWPDLDGEAIVQICWIKLLSLAPAFQSQPLFEYAIRTTLWLAHSAIDSIQLPSDVQALDPRAWRMTVDAPRADQVHCQEGLWASEPASTLAGLRECLIALGAQRAQEVDHEFGAGSFKPCRNHADVYLLPDLNAAMPEPGRASWALDI